MNKKTSQNLIWAAAIIILLTAFLTACGTSGSDGTSPGNQQYLMGGSIQGLELDLAGAVATFAGPLGGRGTADGTGSAARFFSPQGITTDGTNLFVADTNNHTIRQIEIATGEVTTLAGTAGSAGSVDGTGTAARFLQPLGITTDGTNLFVADSSNHTIRQIEIETGVVTTLAGAARSFGSTDGTGSAARFDGPRGITTDGTHLYVAESYNNTIRQIGIATGEVTTIAGTAGTSGSTDGTGSAARFNSPYGITTDGTHLYVADSYNNTIRQIEIATGVVTTFAGMAGTGGFTDDTGSAARFFSPRGITTDGTNLFVADTSNYTIRQIEIATGIVTTLAGTAGTSGSTDDTGTAARFFAPFGITTDGTNLFVADSFNHTIRQIDIASGVVTTLAGTAGSFGSADGTGTAARFNSPYGITTDGTNLFVADTDNNTIRQIDIASGVVTTLAGTAGSFGSADGTGQAARFKRPYGITTDGTNLYVADSFNNTIRQVEIVTAVVTTLAGTAESIGSADGTGPAARFNRPSGITTDGTNLYVADTFNDTIRQIDIASGVVTTLAGTAGSFGSADGTGTAARFNSPYGITTDGTNLYVADTNHNTIRQIEIVTAVVTTLAGTAESIGSADGTGPAARFNRPSGITTDGTNLYVADTINFTIRQIEIATGVVTTLAGTVGSFGSNDGKGSAARFFHPEDITTEGTNLFVADNNNHKIRKID